MIINFEDQTTELTPEEVSLIPVLLRGLRTKGPGNPVKAPEIVSGMNKYIERAGGRLRFTDSRLRKMVNYIRSHGIEAVIATSKGYYVSRDPAEIIAQVRSLEQRARAIEACAEAMRGLMQKIIAAPM